MLSIDYQNVKNHQDVCLLPDGSADPITGNLQPATYALGFSMALSLGVSEITDENLEDVWERVYAWDRIVGPMRVDSDNNKQPFTFAEVKSHVGLRVNASPLTPTKFWRKIRDVTSEEAARAR